MYMCLTTKNDRKSPIVFICSSKNLQEGGAGFLCLDPNIPIEEHRKVLEDIKSQDPNNVKLKFEYGGEE